MEINQICRQIVTDVPAAIGCAVVDLSSGLLLGVSHNVPNFTQSYLDTAAAAAVDMLRGKTISAVEHMLSNMRGNENQKMIQEIQMTTDNTYHFFAGVPGKPSALLVLITTKQANLGSGWASVRMALPKVAPLCP